MRKKTKQKLLSSFMAALVVLSPTLTPMVAKAASVNESNSITRIGGVDQYATAALMALKGWPETTDNVVLSAGMNYSLVDALAAGPLAAKLKAPILLTDNGDQLNSYAKAELLRLQPKKVYITSGTAVIKSSVIDEIKALGITPVQLGGYDQYETSVNIARELASQGADITRVVLAAGWLSPADALSIAPIAAAQGMPILTTSRDQLPASVKTYLDSIQAKVTGSYVVGGTAVVSDAVKNQLPGTVSRYAGQTKYDTNVQILKGLADEYKSDQVYIANGETLVDALAGVSLAAANEAPIVLVNRQAEESTKDFMKLTMAASNMVALGGEAVVPSAVLNNLDSGIEYATDNSTVGSLDSANSAELKDNIRITGNNITLENAQADYSVYVKGENITLKNLKVKGTVFVDPGDSGSATLEGVDAAKIVIRSGGNDSIHLNNTTADVLDIDSSSDVRVESAGTTAIANTEVRSSAILDVQDGSLGGVTILSTPGQSPLVELRGIFTQPVVINNENAQLHLSATAVLPSLIANVKTSLLVDLGAKVTKYDNKGNFVVITGTGAKAIPASSSATSGGSTGTTSGSTGSSPAEDPTNPTTPTDPASVNISGLRVITDPSNSLGPFENGAEIDLSGLGDPVQLLGFAVKADQDCTMKLTFLGKTKNISLTADDEKIITLSDLGENITATMELLREYYSDTNTKTLEGKLLIGGESVGKLKVKLILAK
ncbi:cell wall-binding repeat-containing protein [Desulfosporosinus sp. OT]|uniref:cell wall-binding repeat-containing protein n=1 Tax=Desulfosporosinus sp. OT TaxID=913865 RepID=UPI000223A310|nr:cell wall-binding repeat-containing protein [Desulfosporosinus sp. OT]EGW37801.1 cell wall binding repeat 2 family protein [Desulfosporosinus sp. OT]